MPLCANFLTPLFMPKFLNFEPCFAAKVDKDPTFINQNIVKITMNDLRAKQEMPRSDGRNLRLTLERSAFKLFTVANLRYKLS